MVRINKELATQSLHDSLTKVAESIIFDRLCGSDLQPSSLTRRKAAFLYVDLDRFKSVNDAFGHHIGDQLLIKWQSVT
ncbi:GGDEF domain-containing protein [Simiduia curdlanivorans]|uniref:GGDEF domain-containing protein n=1 Tax=Simiduia curdlanivorans TaxID=1492769 RepID=UPI003390454F